MERDKSEVELLAYEAQRKELRLDHELVSGRMKMDLGVDGTSCEIRLSSPGIRPR